MTHTIRSSRFLSRLAAGGCLALLLPALCAQNRVTKAPDTSQLIVIKVPSSSSAKLENDRGPVAPSLPISNITMNLKMSAAQQANLDRLLEEQRDPSSSEYHRWLTPEEFGARFGVTAADMKQLTAWLGAQGFTVNQVSPSMNWISFSGTAAQVDAAFHTALHTYLADGRTHFANTNDPSVPDAFADVIADFRGLNDFRLKPKHLKTRSVSPDYTTSSGAHQLAPGDIATIFDLAPLYSAGINGTGQKIVVAGQSAINISDIQAFRAQFGLPAIPSTATSTSLLQLVLDGTSPGTVSGDEEESDLDLEWTGAVAPNATIVFVYSSDVITSVQYAISNNLAPVISLSYGGCEKENSASLRSVAQQANAQGITWMASSGDSGAAGCDDGDVATQGLAVNMPASIPEVTAVGGTEFNETAGTTYWSTTNSSTGGSALSYIPETAWNDSAARGDLAASGGGASILFTKPSWQTGPGVPADGARDVPDVSLPASPDHDGYYFYSGGSLGVVGGTSVSAPIFTGMVSLLNEYLVSKGVQAKAGLGNINPTLYHLASSANTIFHDITTGSNIVPCKTGSTNCVNGSLGYTAGPGYDEVTGLGSVDANKLITSWTSLPASISTTTKLTVNPTSITASTASILLTATVTAASGTTVPTGTVTFTLGSTTLGSYTLATSSNGVATLTITGAALASGANSISATYAGSSTFNGSTGTATITNSTPPTAVVTTSSISLNPASITTAQSTTITASVTGPNGAAVTSGTATISLGSTVLATAAATSKGLTASVPLSASTNKLTAGKYTITVAYAATAGFAASTASASLTVTAPATVVSTSTVLTATPSSIAATASTVLKATVTAASGTTAPSGTVTFLAGKTTLGTVNLAGATSGAAATASLSVPGSQLAQGANSITAAYAGTGTFAASTSAAASVTVTGTVPSSAVTVAITPNPVTKKNGGWIFTITLSNSGGATTLTTFTVNGASYAPEIPQFFGTTAIPASGKLTTTLELLNVPVPTSIVFGFGGKDPSGTSWTGSATVPFQ
jgi:subtilase family serine protease